MIRRRLTGDAATLPSLISVEHAQATRTATPSSPCATTGADTILRKDSFCRKHTEKPGGMAVILAADRDTESGNGNRRRVRRAAAAAGGGGAGAGRSAATGGRCGAR